MRSERARLTALYGGLLVLAGALLTAVVYLLVRQGLYASISTAVRGAVPARRMDADTWEQLRTPAPTPSEFTRAQVIDGAVSGAAESAALSRLLTVSLLVLCLYAMVSVALAWWLSGRVLRPVAVITETARRLSGENLHERIALAGPPGELKRLADTFDGMLDRMEQLVTAQQRFAANAAHELRTPVAVQRAAAEIGLAGGPDPAKVARIREKLVAVADDSERIIDGLLLLAASDEGLRAAEPVAVDEVARLTAHGLSAEAARRGVALSVAAEPLTVRGDAVLLDRLVHNLVVNGIRHNVPGGRVALRVGPLGVEVVNTGPVVPEEQVPLLFEPFRRLRERRGGGPGEGAGLGLSIVASIARAHGAVVAAAPNPGGGLTVRVRFPGA
ncbi:ATP-binding protein [Streptomyces sp. NPDC001941]|uniref:ATP-binding protein n=1 Tax=Streptomyces sp. NPDC001941 TaxID=3154659 RepID=UPI00332BC459